MTFSQIKRLIRLHEKAEKHSSEYKVFSAIKGTQSKALFHLNKAERLYSEISHIIKNSTPVSVDYGEENLPGRARHGLRAKNVGFST
jgi:hypothetical protein